MYVAGERCLAKHQKKLNMTSQAFFDQGRMVITLAGIFGKTSRVPVTELETFYSHGGHVIYIEARGWLSPPVISMSCAMRTSTPFLKRPPQSKITQRSDANSCSP
jgi:hypothetical protein